MLWAKTRNAIESTCRTGFETALRGVQPGRAPRLNSRVTALGAIAFAWFWTTERPVPSDALINRQGPTSPHWAQCAHQRASSGAAEARPVLLDRQGGA
jgi:hypothetical protein